MITEIVKVLLRLDDKASAGLEGAKEKADNLFVGLAKGAAAAAAAFISVQAVFDGFNAAIGRADALDDLSEKTGVAVEKLGELAFAARVAGGADINTLAGAFRQLTRAMSRTEQESSKQAEAFKALGVSATNADGSLRDTNEVFGDLADKFQNLENGPEKARLAIELFGGAGQDLIPILNLGREGIEALNKEAQELGLIIPPEQAAAAGTFNDNLERSRSVLEGFFNTLSGAVLPVLNQLVERFIESAKEGGLLRSVLDGIGAVFTTVLVPGIKIVAIVFNSLTATLRLVGRTIGGVAAALVALLRGDFGAARAIAGEIGEDFKSITTDVVDFGSALFGVGNTAATSTTPQLERTRTTINRTGDAAKKATSDLEKMRDTLRVTNDTFGFTEQQKQQYEAAAAYIRDINAGINPQRARQLYLETVELINQNATLREREELEKQNQEDAKKRLKEAEDEAKRAKQELDSLLSGTSEVLLSDVQRNIQVLTDALNSNQIREPQYLEAVEQQLKRLTDANKKAGEEIVDFWAEAGKGIQSNLQTFFFDALQGDFSDLGGSIKRTIDSIIAQILAARAATALFGADFSRGNIGGFVGSAISGLSGLLGRSAGGGVRAGVPYRTVEMGPEILVPSVNGRIIPNNEVQKMMDGGGNRNVSVTIQTMDASSFTQNLSRFKREIAEIVSDGRQSYRLRGA